jgi:Protein of unknown function (DUF4239)
VSRWLVSYVPAGVLLVLLVVLVSGGAMLIQRFVRRRFPTLTGDEHNDVTRFTYGFIGFVYAFFTGFIVSTMWGQINTADGDARSEGAAAVQMVRDAVVFDGSDRAGIQSSLRRYASAAIGEWNTADLATSKAADEALAGVYAAYQQVRPTTDVQKAALATSQSNLDEISQARTVRLLTAREDTGPPGPLWAVILVTSALVLGTAIVYGVERPRLHYPMVAIVGIIVATNLFLVLELSHPYAGAVSTSSDALQEVLRVLDR